MHTHTHSHSTDTMSKLLAVPGSMEEVIETHSIVESTPVSYRSSASSVPATVEEEWDSGRRQLNQYTIEGVLGEGSYSTVYLAIDSWNRRYAVKEMSKSRIRRDSRAWRLFHQTPGSPQAASADDNGMAVAAGEEDGLESVRTEIAIMKRLRHPNLVRLYEILDDPDEDLLYMVFELCSKGPVMKLNAEGQPVPALSEDRARSLFRQLVLGIEYLHFHDIVHRDIKPDNLLLSEEGTLKIADFGVSLVLGQRQESRGAAGSPAFIAPELFKPGGDGEQSFDWKGCDLWAMGVTLYCFLAGQPPFQGDTLKDLKRAILNDTLTLPVHWTELVKDVLIRLLDKNPAKRISLADLKVHPWLTRTGRSPMISTAENCAQHGTLEASERDVGLAVGRGFMQSMVLTAGKRLRRLSNLIKQLGKRSSNPTQDTQTEQQQRSSSRDRSRSPP